MKLKQILKNKLVDTHCHLHAEQYTDIDQIISAAQEEGVEQVFAVSVDLASSKQSLEIASRYNNVLAAVGIDPELVIPISDMFIGEIDNTSFNKWLEEMRTFLDETLAAGEAQLIGECGMDNYRLSYAMRNQEITKESYELSLTRQEQLFRMHCGLAQKYQLPLSIHSRSVEKRCFAIIEEYQLEAIFHSYTGSLKLAKRIVAAGHYLGVNGIITYESAEQVRELYRQLLKGKIQTGRVDEFYEAGIVFETDAPWLHPFDPMQLNTPAQVTQVFEHLKSLL